MPGKDKTSLVRSPKAMLAGISGWDDLTEKEKITIVKETAELNESIVAYGKARVAIGEHLSRIRDILEPRRMFIAYLKATPFNVSVATAYRYIDIYTGAKEVFSGPVMRLALAMGMDTIDPKLVKKNPPPDTSSEIKINEYLRDLQQKQRAARVNELETDSEILKKEAFNSVRTRMDRLSARQRKIWLQSLVSMLLHYVGENGEEIPEHYIIPRGRPRIIQGEAKAG